MNIDLIRLLVDFGMLVLIWMVQLVVYPGMCHYKTEDLNSWHKIYTKRIAVIVAPLMIVQVLVSVVQFFNRIDIYTAGSIIFIIIIWLLTFLIFVPLHNSIGPDKSCERITNNLVSKNWWRTGLWSLLFIWTFFENL
ncbi:hypothetical protein RM545_12350 [Zunongwangia sp. F260]|uniref:Uncharacterized protein n=1 Tax=Autumnicola lenta TaxID=3075593 RepID=A0ABU3CMA6_9FLAO|nr:hypothetical protein [Zunongwangia sp. F260]MDT0647482.1 hypothetical protein [Zunongwangia sp. F260]